MSVVDENHKDWSHFFSFFKKRLLNETKANAIILKELLKHFLKFFKPYDENSNLCSVIIFLKSKWSNLLESFFWVVVIQLKNKIPLPLPQISCHFLGRYLVYYKTKVK